MYVNIHSVHLKLDPFHYCHKNQQQHPFNGQVQIPNGTSTGSAAYAQLMADCPYTLESAALSPKIALPMGDLGPI